MITCVQMSYNNTKVYLLMRSGADTLVRGPCVIAQDQLIAIPKGASCMSVSK